MHYDFDQQSDPASSVHSLEDEERVTKTLVQLNRNLIRLHQKNKITGKLYEGSDLAWVGTRCLILRALPLHRITTCLPVPNTSQTVISLSDYHLMTGFAEN